MKKQKARLALEEKYSNYIEELTAGINVEGNSIEEKLASIRKLISQDTIGMPYRVAVLNWMYKNIKREEVLFEIPEEITDIYELEFRKLLEKYVKPCVFGDVSRMFREKPYEHVYIHKDVADNVILLFVGSFLVKTILNGDVAREKRSTCVFNFSMGRGNVCDLRAQPASVRGAYEKYFQDYIVSSKYHYDQLRDNSNPSLVLLEEGEAGASWFTGNFVPQGEKGKVKIERDFIFPVMRTIFANSETRYMDSVTNPKYYFYRYILSSTDSFDWNQRYYRYDEYGIERDYSIGVTTEYDYSATAAERMRQDGWMEKFFHGYMWHPNAPISQLQERLDRAMYYHFPKTRYRIYSLGFNTGCEIKPYSRPVIFLELIPDDTTPPDQAFPAYKVKGKDWVKLSNIPYLQAKEWFAQPLNDSDWYIELGKKCSEHCEKVRENFADDLARYYEEVAVRQEKITGVKTKKDSEQDIKKEMQKAQEATKYRAKMKEEIEALKRAMPSQLNEDDKAKLFSKLKKCLKVIPVVERDVFSILSRYSSLGGFCDELFNIQQPANLFEPTGCQHRIDKHTYALEAISAGKFFIETSVVKLILEGEVEKDKLANKYWRENLEKPDEIQTAREQAAYLLISAIRHRTADNENEKWRKEYAKQLAAIDALDRKYQLTEKFHVSVQRAEAELEFNLLSSEKCMKKFRKIFANPNSTLPQAAASANWLFGTFEDSEFLAGEIPEVIPAKDIDKYNNLLFQYVKPEILNPEENTWKELSFGRRPTADRILLDLRLLAPFVKPITSGEDARLLRTTYFASALTCCGKSHWFQTCRAITSGKAKERLDYMYAKALAPVGKYLKENSKKEDSSRVLREGKVKDIWIPLYINQDAIAGTLKKGEEVYPVPTIKGLWKNPRSGDIDVSHIPAINYRKTSNSFFSRSSYERGALTYKKPWALPVDVDFDCTFDRFLSLSEIFNPWASPVPGLDSRGHKLMLQRRDPKLFSKVVFAHFPQISWKACCFGRSDSSQQLYTNGIAIVISPENGDIPDKFESGLMEGSKEAVFTDGTVPTEEDYETIVDQNPSVISVFEDCSELVFDLSRIAEERRESREKQLQAYLDDWGGRSQKVRPEAWAGIPIWFDDDYFIIRGRNRTPE